MSDGTMWGNAYAIWFFVTPIMTGLALYAVAFIAFTIGTDRPSDGYSA